MNFEVSNKTLPATKKGCIIFSVVYLVAMVIANVKLYSGGQHSFSALFLLDLLACFFLCALVCSFAKVFFTDRENDVSVQARKFCAFVAICVAAAFVLECLTIFGSPAHSVTQLSDWNPKRIIVFFAASYSLLIVFIFKKEKIQFFFKELTHKATKRNIAIALSFLLASFVVSFFISVIISPVLLISQRALLVFIFLFLCCAASITVFVIKRKAKPEYIFLALALAIGGSIALIPPAQTGLSWDDQIHYQRALGVSYLENPAFSEGCNALINVAYFPDVFLEDKSTDSVNQYHGYINELDSRGAFEMPGSIAPGPESTSIVSYNSFGYIPMAIGLWIGRVLHLSLVHDFILGRLCNLLFYVAICFFAIRVIPVKKTLFACVALLPTSLFLAANYSYDSWLTSLVMLGIALFFREYYSDDELSPDNWFLILFVFLIALGPKAIYFPVLGILFMMPKRKFSTTKQYRLFIGSIILVGLVVLLSFVAPFISSSGGSGDLRGGSDVSSSGQISFILSDPIGYIGMLCDFIFNRLLTIPSSDGYSFGFGYFGGMGDSIPRFLSGFSFVMLLIIGFLDISYKKKEPRIGERIWVAFLVLLTIALISTSLYVSFTPVGLSTINGVQARYLIPLVFLTISVCFSYKLPQSMPSKNALIVSQCSFGFLGFLCVYMLILSQMIL